MKKYCRSPTIQMVDISNKAAGDPVSSSCHTTRHQTSHIIHPAHTVHGRHNNTTPPASHKYQPSPFLSKRSRHGTQERDKSERASKRGEREDKRGRHRSCCDSLLSSLHFFWKALYSVSSMLLLRSGRFASRVR